MTVLQSLRPRVSDTTPIIVLAKVGRLDVLTAGGRTVLIVETVAREIEAGSENDPARMALRSGWGTRTPDAAVPAFLSSLRLDAGEEATLALTLEKQGVAILDDGEARKAARDLGLPHTGTVGLVLEAKRLGVIASTTDVLHDLQDVGLYLPSDTELKRLLAVGGEIWP